MKLKLSEIIIPESFKQSTPKNHKIDECGRFYDIYQEQDRYLVVNHDNGLVDGYIMYLVLLQREVEYAKIKVHEKKIGKWNRRDKGELLKSYRHSNTVYVFGKHDAEGKEFVWRIPESLKRTIVNILPGETVAVRTKYGVKKILVTRIEELGSPPYDGRIKKVVKVV